MCMYCESTESDHFICSICGNGMCDDCYDADTEHTEHTQHLIETEPESLVEIFETHGYTISKSAVEEAYISICGFPDYVCYPCAITLKQKVFHAIKNKIIAETSS